MELKGKQLLMGLGVNICEVTSRGYCRIKCSFDMANMMISNTTKNSSSYAKEEPT